jgi:sugar lactone lactonase YvrE
MAAGIRQTLLDGLAFGEGPRWHDGAFWFSDMHAYRVVRVDAAGTPETIFQHHRPVSGLGWLPDGQLLVVDMDGDILRIDAGTATTHADLRSIARFGVNDMITHPEGWSYVSQFGFDRHAGHEGAAPSVLVRADADGAVSAAAPEMLMVANGMCITPDGTTLLVAETPASRISAFTIGNDGTLHDHRVWAQLPPGHMPDGMCLDAEGAVWAACVVGDCFDRVVEGGAVVESIVVDDPGRHAIACVLGGPERRTLYALTAETFGGEEESRATMSAQVELVEVDVPGAGLP